MVQENTAGNPLSAGSLSLFMATSLPKGEGSQLKNPTEAVALAVHAGMIAVGFRLIGLGEDERIGKMVPTSFPFITCFPMQVLRHSQKPMQTPKTLSHYPRRGTRPHHTHSATRTHNRLWNI